MRLKQELWLQGLREGQRMRFQPLGGSMMPCLRQGDTVSIHPGRDCCVGDIILWCQDESLVLHRVVAQRHDRIITKGDFLSHLDAPVARGQILGRVVARERRGRVRRLDSLEARSLGLAWCLTSLIPGLVLLLSVARRVLGNPAQPPLWRSDRRWLSRQKPAANSRDF